MCIRDSCKKEIQSKIALHYPEVEREAVWEQVQLRYAELLSKWRTDLGGKKNFHNEMCIRDRLQSLLAR